MDFKTDFKFFYKPGDLKRRPLLLLHGTGGTETDLVSLAEAVAPGRALLSPRGQVVENGMPRFFKRFAEGLLDEDDIRVRAKTLSTFIRGATAHYGLRQPIALGFSNGANMAASLLLLEPGLLAAAVLLRAMAPFKILPEVDLTGTSVLLSSGEHDQMIPLADAKRLATHLTTHQASVIHHIFPTGHGLTQTDLPLITQFLNTQE